MDKTFPDIILEAIGAMKFRNLSDKPHWNLIWITVH